MGVTFLTVRVSNPAKPNKARDVEFLVDSGALYTVLPGSELKSLGIEPTSTEEFTLANGEHLRLRVGNANFEYQQKIRAAPVVFGKSGVYLLGVTTLEALGLLLDPIRRELRPVPMVLMPALRSTGTIAMANRVVVNTNRKNRKRRQAHGL